MTSPESYMPLNRETQQHLEFKLRFINSPPPVIFTYSRIKAEDGSSIAVELVDAATETRVTLGSLSSSLLKIVALDADFTEESWTVGEFYRNIVQSPEGKHPLLVGDLIMTLKDGVGVIEDVIFTHNSSWLRSQKFRLGAVRITEKLAVTINEKVGQARSEAFVCKDHLGDSSYGPEKHHPPFPESEVCKLEGIPKRGVEASRLAEEGIHTVKELRRCIAMNPDALHRILGTLVSKKTLDNIVSHAMCCKGVDERGYHAYNVHAQGAGAFLLVNDFYELKEVSLDGLTILNSDELTFKQKELIDKLKLEAYENVTRFTAVDKQSFVHHPRESLSEPSNKSEVLPPDRSPKYDGVIRYREGDISNSFVSHLHAALSQKGIEIITVHEEFDKVPECRVEIRFISSGHFYCNGRIYLNRQPRKEQDVSQMFYRLSSSGWICNKKKLERFSLHDKQMWSDRDVNVLKKAPDYISIKQTESELMHEIVRDVLKELYSSDKENMIGMDTQVEDILSLLCIESQDVRRIGIWGTAGIGKTTIAEKLFRRISFQYKTCVFLKDIYKQVEENGQVTVRDEFLSKLLEVEPSLLWSSDINTCFLRSRLQCKRVLVILDDVNDFRDVETFLENLNYFGPGSRIIITSRNRRVFVQSKIDHIYEVKPLDISTSLLLLDSGTSESVISMSTADWRKQSLELVRFANGNLEVLNYLKSRSHGERNQLLQEVLETSPICIPRILRSCYGLEENEINIFLDIACFFRRMDKDNVAKLLDGCGFFADVGFRSLVERSLLTISHNLVDMHRFIQATGREIVRQESPKVPGKRSRLWNPEEIVDVFLYDSGTSTIEGIFLDMSKKKFDANPNIFEKMWNLRLLKFYCSEVMENRIVSLPQGLKYLPSKLRLLHWEYYPLSSLPRSFNPRNLVELNLPNSCAKKLWKGKKSLEKLIKMRLSYSYQLTKIPRLSSAPNLEFLDLEGCNSLLSISQSITYLKKLVFLNLKDCSKLDSIPSMVDVESLEVINLSGCSKLENFPEISPNVKELYMSGTMIQEIPSSIKNLVLLEKLDLENCRHLKNLPTSICKLKHLEVLNLSGCTSLERFPDLSRRMKCLRFLDLSKTAIKELPSSISYLTALEELRYVDSKNVVRLPDKPIDLQGPSQDFLTHFAPKSERVKPIYLQGSSSDFRTHVAPKSKTIKQPSHSSTSSENGCDEEEAMEEEVETEGTGALFTQLGDMAGEACSITTNKSDSLKIVSNISPIYASGGSIIKSWQKGQLLGRGSFGSVYEGIPVDGDFFAVKEVSLLEVSLLEVSLLFQGSQAQECIQQLEGEIALLSQLEHPNIVRYRGTAKDELNLYIFLELVTQGSLLRLYQRYQLTDSIVSLYTRQILDGLKYLHDSGFIHSNIKCANVLVDASGATKLADFGLAKVSKLFDIKFQRGTPFWAAPEVINRKRNNGYGTPADIWSLGCTVLEMLTGQIPYTNWEPVVALFRIGTGKLPEIPDTLSLDARDFILKCLQVNPEERPTVNELLNHPFVRSPLPSSGSGLGSASLPLIYKGKTI